MPQASSSKCIVTLLIGEPYRIMWENTFADTWRRYAAAHGYDIVVIDDYIDPTPRARERSPHWQKCLILEHPEVRRHQHVVWIDSDIMINYHTAPCIVEATPSGMVGAVSYHDLNSATPKLKANRRDREYNYSLRFGNGNPFGLNRAATPADRYRAIGLDPTVDDFINTGVLVLETDQHASVLRQVYDHAVETSLSMYENTPLSHALLQQGLVHRLDPRFNADYLYEMLESYPFLLMKEFQTEDRNNLRLRILSANVIWNNNFFLHCVSGAPTSRQDVRWIFRDAGEWERYLFHFQNN